MGKDSLFQRTMRNLRHISDMEKQGVSKKLCWKCRNIKNDDGGCPVCEANALGINNTPNPALMNPNQASKLPTHDDYKKSHAQNMVKKPMQDNVLKKHEKTEIDMAYEYIIKAFDILKDIGSEIIDRTNSDCEELNKKLNENFDFNLEYSELLKTIKKADGYTVKAGARVKEGLIVSEDSIKFMCGKKLDINVEGSNSVITTCVSLNIWLKDSNQQISTSHYREQYLRLMELTKKFYVFSAALLRIYYEHNKMQKEPLKNIPATKFVYGELLLEGACDSTYTKPPFISKSIFDTGNNNKNQ